MYSGEIDAIVFRIIKKYLDIDIHSTEITELILRHLWGFTPKEAYKQVTIELPKDNYKSFELGNICQNCLFFGFPCKNCASYVFNYYIGLGHGNKYTYINKKYELDPYFTKWYQLVKFRPKIYFHC